MTGDKPRTRRPYRVMVARRYSFIRREWVALPKPQCVATYATRERAERAYAPHWWHEMAAYIDGPDTDGTQP